MNKDIQISVFALFVSRNMGHACKENRYLTFPRCQHLLSAHLHQYLCQNMFILLIVLRITINHSHWEIPKLKKIKDTFSLLNAFGSRLKLADDGGYFIFQEPGSLLMSFLCHLVISTLCLQQQHLPMSVRILRFPADRLFELEPCLHLLILDSF